MSLGKVTHEAIEKLSHQTGLTKSTIRDLLERGWTFEDKMGDPPKWIHPLSTLTKS